MGPPPIGVGVEVVVPPAPGMEVTLAPGPLGGEVAVGVGVTVDGGTGGTVKVDVSVGRGTGVYVRVAVRVGDGGGVGVRMATTALWTGNPC